jgi:hypothetical protein
MNAIQLSRKSLSLLLWALILSSPHTSQAQNTIIGSPGQGIILKSPNGATCRLLSIDNAGQWFLRLSLARKIGSNRPSFCLGFQRRLL